MGRGGGNILILINNVDRIKSLDHFLSSVFLSVEIEPDLNNNRNIYIAYAENIIIKGVAVYNISSM